MVKRDFRSKLLFLCSSHTLLHVYTNLPLALLPILIREYELSILIASIVVSIPRVFSLVFSIPSGLLADRMSHSKLISFSLFLQVIAASIIIAFPSLKIVVLGFSLIALASALYHPSALSATGNISPPEFMSRGFGFHGASGTLGISLGPLTLGLLLNWFEWRFIYLIWITPILAVGIIALFVKLSGPPLDRNEEVKKGLTAPLRNILSVAFTSFLLLMLFRSLAGGAISTYLTTYLTDSRGLDASLASIVFGLNPLVGLISVIVGGYGGDKLGWKKSLTLLVSTATAALFFMFVSASTIQTVLFYLIYGFFSIMTMPITTSLVGKIVPPESRGTAYSLQFIPESVMGIMMPIALGVLIEPLGIWIIFPTAMVCYFIVLAIVQVLRIQ
ncbi:MAG: MFS transporter [Candidatus Bathyarchaeota archaeon]|nr:MFS transporter [Candidatus Bathyarchaeota archaeon]